VTGNKYGTVCCGIFYGAVPTSDSVDYVDAKCSEYMKWMYHKNITFITLFTV